MATQQEVITAANWAIERLSKGQPVSETILESQFGSNTGREALVLVRQWEASPEGKVVVARGEDIGVSGAISRQAQREGFRSDTAFLESRAGEQPRETYVEPPNVPNPQSFSISKAELQKGLAEGTIKAGGTYKDEGGQVFTATVTEQRTQAVKTQFQRELDERVELIESQKQSKRSEEERLKAEAERFRG